MIGAARVGLITSTLAVFLLAACGGPDRAPIETRMTLAEYPLQPGDRIMISVFGQDDLKTEATIPTDGRLEMPLIGLVEAGGKTVAGLRDDLTTLLNDGYLVDPQVTIEILKYRLISVLGEVTRPGRFDFEPGMSVQDVVALAGGFSRRAEEDEVVLTRRFAGAEPIERTALPTTALFPGDIIRVRRRWF
jgi:polysaccharide export outer membrane protein